LFLSFGIKVGSYVLLDSLLTATPFISFCSFDSINSLSVGLFVGEIGAPKEDTTGVKASS